MAYGEDPVPPRCFEQVLHDGKSYAASHHRGYVQPLNQISTAVGYVRAVGVALKVVTHPDETVIVSET